MARIRKSELAFDAITLEGSLISPAKLAEVAERKAGEQSEVDYHIPKGLTLRDETARYFRIGQALFRELFAGNRPSQQATVRFAQELLRDVFGFADIDVVTGPKVHGDRTYVVSLDALKGRVPVVIVPPSDDLDDASTHLSQDRRRSAATSLQDWLNAEENALWGLCCNGERLRVLRDNQSLTRPAYIEANLRQIFESEDFAGFAVLWLILHASRFGRPDSPVTDCALERWREAGSKEGVTARARLSDSVEQALHALGNGFLGHPANFDLRDRLTSGQLQLPDFFNELLRLVYRLIFLLAAEDRGLLHRPDAPDSSRKLYADGYSLGSLRDRAIRRSGWNQFHDRWEGLLIVFRALAHGEQRLGLPALGGLFEDDATANLDRARLSNHALMEAIFRLAWLREDSSIVPVNWRDMETEELGSVYEGLLELTPRLTQDGRGFAFAEGLETKGNERKKTGSYYTPDSLVQALLDSALDPVLDRVESEAQDASSALLGVSVIDPACGSGHFLLGAARRIATRIARLRTGGVPSAADYRHALRDAVRRCIHGVDRNPMAIELARVALWIETVEPGKPLGFLDANLRVGDSLLGIFDLKALEKGIPDAAYKPLTGDDKGTAKDFERRNKRDKGERAGFLDFAGRAAQPFSLPPLAQSLRSVRELPEDTLDQIAAKRARFSSAYLDPRLVNLAQAADLYISAFLTPKTGTQSLDLHTSLVPTTEDVWTAMRAGTVYGPRLGSARHLAVEARAFHWPLEFPDVMDRGGFDVVLGNPPWERIKIQEQEFFAAREPAIAEAQSAGARSSLIRQLKEAPNGTREWLLHKEFEIAKRIAEASSEFARVDGNNGGRFPLTGRGDINTYALFAELFSVLIRDHGSAGVIVPSGIATDATTAPFFGSLVERQGLVRLISFENEEFVFPSVHHAYKFCLLTMANGGCLRPEFVFFLRQADQMEDLRRRFTLSPAEIARINPTTKTAPTFRSRADADLTSRIYGRVPVLINKAMETGNPWDVRLRTMLHKTNASNAGILLTAVEAPGGESMSSQWLPVHEGDYGHQFDHRFGTFNGVEVLETNRDQHADPVFEPRFELVAQKSGVQEILNRWGVSSKKPALLGFRRVSLSTNLRTSIATLLPNMPLTYGWIVVIDPPTTEQCLLLANFNSLVFDYCLRNALNQPSIPQGVFEQTATLPPSAYKKSDVDFVVARVLELMYTSESMTAFARDLGYGGPPFAWDENRRALLRSELDAWYFRSYGLTSEEVRYVLDPADALGADYPSKTFHVLKNNEMKQFGEYRTRRLILNAWNRMESGEIPAPEPYDMSRSAPDSAESHARLGTSANHEQSMLHFAGDPTL